VDAEEDAYRRARGVEGLDLWSQREASPEVSRAEMPGAGQQARRVARERVGPTSAEKVHLIALAIEAHGPMNRTEIHEVTGLKKDSVNGRVADGRGLPEGHEDRMDTEGSRNGQSLVHLFRLRPHSHEE
jgi:hypothetical protein